MDAAFYGNDIFYHEIGHIIAELLEFLPEPPKDNGAQKWFQSIAQGFNYLLGRMPKFGFEHLLNHPLMKNLFFPQYSPELVAEIRKKWSDVLAKILNTPNFEEGLKELIGPDTDIGCQFWPLYEKTFQGVPKDENFIPTITERIAKDKKFLYLFQTIYVYSLCYLAPWDQECEMLQIAGLGYYTNYAQPLLLVNPWCDINLWLAWEQYKQFNTYFFYWSHWVSAIDSIPDFINWCPAPEYIVTLLRLLKIDMNLFPTLKRLGL